MEITQVPSVWPLSGEASAQTGLGLGGHETLSCPPAPPESTQGRWEALPRGAHLLPAPLSLCALSMHRAHQPAVVTRPVPWPRTHLLLPPSRALLIASPAKPCLMRLGSPLCSWRSPPALQRRLFRVPPSGQDCVCFVSAPLVFHTQKALDIGDVLCVGRLAVGRK